MCNFCYVDELNGEKEQDIIKCKFDDIMRSPSLSHVNLSKSWGVISYRSNKNYIH